MRTHFMAAVCVATLLAQSGCTTAPPGAGDMMMPNAVSACMQITTDPSLAMNSCNNPHDKCFETTNNKMVRAISGNCATGKSKGPSGDDCIKYSGNPTSPEAVKCFTECAKSQFMSTLGDTLSDQCLLCPDAVVACGGKFCLLECINDPLSPACTTCLCATHPDVIGPGKPGNCLQDSFAQCAGYRPTAEAVGCTATGAPAGGAMAMPMAGRASTMTAGSGVMSSAGGPAMGSAGTSTGAAGSGAMAGQGAGGSGASGTGASGMNAGGAGGSTGQPHKVKHACLKAPANVEFVGDSYVKYFVAHTDLDILVASNAVKDGALTQGQRYSDDAAPGTTFASGAISGQWASAKAANKNIQVVVMDGGGNDVLIDNMQCKADGASKLKSCQDVVANSLMIATTMIADMKAAGVKEVVYFFYPHPPTGGWEIDDYSIPLFRAMCDGHSDENFQCRFIDTVPIFNGHDDWYYADGIHANDTGEQAIADAVWKQLKDDCAAQAASSMCCTP